MTNINASNFIDSFKLQEATVGIIGHGFVGRAMHEFFKGKSKIVIYDKTFHFNTLKEVVEQSDVIFVCVNTPMKKDGSCFTGNVEEVISDIVSVAKEVGRNLDSFIVTVKSTVYPGFIEEMQVKHLPLRICFSPEFLTEKNSVNDMKNTNRIIVGGDEDDALVVCKFFADADPDMISTESGPPKRLILQTDPTTAELVKLYANGMLATKVMFSNEIYQVCQKLGIDYNDVRSLACLDERIGIGHTQVPGPDGFMGFGGHCFPKDLNSLRAVCRELGVSEKVISAVIERNEELREKKDWLEMKGRAVVE